MRRTYVRYTHVRGTSIRAWGVHLICVCLALRERFPMVH
jgi:hypothetical protein